MPRLRDYAVPLDVFKAMAEQHSHAADAFRYAVLFGTAMPDPPETPEGLDEDAYLAHCIVHGLVTPMEFDSISHQPGFIKLNPHWGAARGQPPVCCARPRR